MQELSQKALDLMLEIRELSKHINGKCEALDLFCGRVPFWLAFKPVLVKSVDRPNVFELRRLRLVGDYVSVQISNGYDYSPLPLTGVEAELFVQSLDEYSLPEFVRWLERVRSWLVNRRAVIDRRAERKLKRLRGRIGWLQSLVLWINDILSFRE